MSYIGAQQGTSSPVLLDSITVVNNQAAYTMQKDGVNYTPASTLVMQVSLNGIIQAPNSSYTINGSTITFDSALVTGDVIDYILVREPTTGTIAPVDGSITTSKLASGAVTDAKITSMASSKLTGALPALDGSALTGISSSPILQVVYGELTSKVTVSSASFVDIGLSASITPSSTSSDLLIIPSISAGINNNGSVASFDLTDSSNNSIVNHTDALSSRIKGIGQITAAGSTVGFFSMLHFGMPIKISPNTTSQVTYKVRAKRDGATLQINATGNDTDNPTYVRTISTLTIMEIGA